MDGAIQDLLHEFKVKGLNLGPYLGLMVGLTVRQSQCSHLG